MRLSSSHTEIQILTNSCLLAAVRIFANRNDLNNRFLLFGSKIGSNLLPLRQLRKNSTIVAS